MERIYNSFDSGIIDSGSSEQVTPRGLWDAENVNFDSRGTIAERDGTSQYGSTVSGSRRILALHGYNKYSTTTIYPLMAFDSDVYRLVSSTWTAQSLSLTQDTEGTFIDAYDNVYYNNGTDNTQIFDGSSWSSDASFKKSKIMVFFENRIIVAVGANLWYTDLGSTTFQSTSYLNLQQEITGLLAGDYYLYVFTETDMYRINRFEQYEATIYGPESFELTPCHVGTCCHRSLVKIGGYIYTLTRSGIYRIEQQGLSATRITVDIEGTFGGLDPDYLSGSSAAAFNDKYYIAVRDSSQSYNNRVLIFDTNLLHESPFKQGAVVPAMTQYTYSDATLYPEVLAVIPASTGERRLYFGDGNSGKVFRMEDSSVTADNSSAITSYAIKPILNDVNPDFRKRLMKVQLSHETLGAYDILVAFKNDDFGTYSDELVDLTAAGGTWGTGQWGAAYSPGIWGNQTAKKTYKKPNKRGFYFFVRIKNDQADEPWKISRIACKYRVRARYQPAGNSEEE